MERKGVFASYVGKVLQPVPDFLYHYGCKVIYIYLYMQTKLEETYNLIVNL